VLCTCSSLYPSLPRERKKEKSLLSKKIGGRKCHEENL